MKYYRASPDPAPLLVLAHGAGAGEDHPWIRLVAQALCDRSVSVVTFDFPYIRAGRRLPDRAAVLEEAWRSVWQQVTGDTSADRARPSAVFAGGKSMGGRIASQVAAGGGFIPRPQGLVFFGYPLHPPAKPALRRDRHLPQVEAPMLFLQGARDPLGAPEELQALVDSLSGASLHLVEGGDHSLRPRRREDPDGRALDAVLDVAAGWMRERTGMIR